MGCPVREGLRSAATASTVTKIRTAKIQWIERRRARFRRWTIPPRIMSQSESAPAPNVLRRKSGTLNPNLHAKDPATQAVAIRVSREHDLHVRERDELRRRDLVRAAEDPF